MSLTRRAGRQSITVSGRVESGDTGLLADLLSSWWKREPVKFRVKQGGCEAYAQHEDEDVYFFEAQGRDKPDAFQVSGCLRGPHGDPPARLTALRQALEARQLTCAFSWRELDEEGEEGEEEHSA